MLNIVLYKPEIPPNTGNISRLCVCIGATLHIVEKPAFDLSDKAVKRAGLDYWNELDFHYYPSWNDFKERIDQQRTFIVTKFGKRNYTDIQFKKFDFIIFGNETSGLPEKIHNQFLDDQKIRIPMKPISRSINLSNSVAIISYEMLRQFGFNFF